MSEYILPSIDLLDNTEYLFDNNLDDYKNKIEKLLEDFKVYGEVVSSVRGPISLEFEVLLKPGIKLSKLLDLKDEFCLYLGNQFVKLEGPRDNKNTVGIKIPNIDKYNVSLREVFIDKQDNLNKMNIPFVLGKKDTGENIVDDLSKIQHLLIGGFTGTGKTNYINSLITTILMTKKPEEVKFLMIDMKGIDLNLYNGIPHLIYPVINNPKEAIDILFKMNNELDNRYNKFISVSTKTITSYNKIVEKDNNLEKIPYIVLIIDWIDDLLLINKESCEDALIKLLKYGDEAGIHLVITSQRPEMNIMSNDLKENINSRMCFQVRGNTNSKMILDEDGAEKIDGIGECIYKPLYGEKVLSKVAYIEDSEIRNIIDHVRKQQETAYSDLLVNTTNEEDNLYNEVLEYVTTTEKASASLIQRKFSIGYNEASRIIDRLEEEGIIGPINNQGKREVLVKKQEEINIKYCMKCGNEIKENNKYCGKCGTKIN